MAGAIRRAIHWRGLRSRASRETSARGASATSRRFQTPRQTRPRRFAETGVPNHNAARPDRKNTFVVTARSISPGRARARCPPDETPGASGNRSSRRRARQRPFHNGHGGSYFCPRENMLATNKRQRRDAELEDRPFDASDHKDPRGPLTSRELAENHQLRQQAQRRRRSRTPRPSRSRRFAETGVPATMQQDPTGRTRPSSRCAQARLASAKSAFPRGETACRVSK